MEKNKKNEELQSRREFFKKAAKGALPILGAIVLSGVPTIIKAAETPMGCGQLSCLYGCKNSCQGDCYTGCKGGCSSLCRMSCTGSCKDGCHTSCSGGCSYRMRY